MMQLRIQHSTALLKVLFFFVFILSLFVANQVKAETANPNVNPQQYIAGLGPINFGQGGGAFLPPQVLQAMATGKISPILQFVLINNVMTQTIKKALTFVPNIRDPYVIALEKFTFALCMIKKSFEEQMLLALLPELSANEDYGGSADPQDRQAAQQQALVMAQAFSKDGGCDGKDNDDKGIDPNLIALITQMGGGGQQVPY